MSRHRGITRQSRRIAVLTVGRSDFSRYRPILRALQQYSHVKLRLFAIAGHFSPVFGETWREIAESGFNFEPNMELTLVDGVGEAIAAGTCALTRAFVQERPDLLVLLGDRYEMLCGANAALGFNLPIVHIHGGAVTEGAIDEQVRHALTKMSHVHLVSTEVYATRVRQMGEEDWRVQVVGAPGLDELTTLAIYRRGELADKLGLNLTDGFLLVSYHPVTLELQHTVRQIDDLLQVLGSTPLPSVITYPNADPGNQVIIAAIEKYAATHPGKTHVLPNAGSALYSSLMAHASAMIGNSSSGLVEAPSFRLPVVNIGSRQDGKIKPANVIDSASSTTAISAALTRALSPAFRESLRSLVNPYGDGKTGPRIAEILVQLALDDQLLRKRFIDR